MLYVNTRKYAAPYGSSPPAALEYASKLGRVRGGSHARGAASGSRVVNDIDDATSLVPLLAVSLAAFAAFPSFSETRAALEEAVMSVLPLSYSEVIMKYLKVFSDHASGLGAFGLAGLALTALLMIDKFFVTVNRIFRVRRMRSWAQRAMIYWALLTLGPIAIALSITLSTQAIRIAAGAAGTGGLPGWLSHLFRSSCRPLAMPFSSN